MAPCGRGGAPLAGNRLLPPAGPSTSKFRVKPPTPCSNRYLRSRLCELPAGVPVPSVSVSGTELVAILQTAAAMKTQD
eukprot:9455560-Alexandrium_andersonii.AAC.1